MTTQQKQQELLSRMVTSLSAETTQNVTAKQLATKTDQLLKEVRKFNDAMSVASANQGNKRVTP